MENQQQTPFFTIAKFSIPRILGLGDRDPESPTYGCFDRNYWHYKLLDLPNIRFQEAVSMLALLYRHNLVEEFYQNQKVRSLAIAAIEFAFSRQNSDGSFNEVYPFERSFCGTSFAGCALAESMLALKLEGWEAQLTKLADWLARNNNVEVANQMAAAANALYAVYAITHNTVYHDAALRKIDLMKRQKGQHRYLPEYGGFDLGYLSITLSHLASLWKLSHHEGVREMAEDAMDLIDETLDDYGRFDWMTMSRTTQFVYPHGFAVFKQFPVLEKLKNGLAGNMILNPAWMDDRYCIAFALDYLKTDYEMRCANAHDNE